MSDNWRGFADSIVNLVQNAVDDRDFTNLSNDIRNVVNDIKTSTSQNNNDTDNSTDNIKITLDKMGSDIRGAVDDIKISVGKARTDTAQNKTTKNGYRQQVYHGVEDENDDLSTDYKTVDLNKKTLDEEGNNTDFIKTGEGAYKEIMLANNSLPGRLKAPVRIILGGMLLFANAPVVAVGDLITSIFADVGLSTFKDILGAGFGFVSLLIVIVAIAMIVSGIKRIKLNSSFVKYKTHLSGRTYFDIKKLSIMTGQTKRKTLKNINRMIKDGYFVEGHVDDDDTTLILTDEVYEDYLLNKERQKVYLQNNEIPKNLFFNKKDNDKLSNENTKKENIDNNVDADQHQSQEDSIITEGKQYIEYVRHCNELIKDEEMSNKLTKLEDIITHIFEVLKKDSGKTEETQRLMDYYLPTTKKLLDAYIEFDNQPSYGDNNIANTKKEIEDAIDVINEAFGRLFDDMFEEKAWDISSDIKTMKAMMANDGLTDEGHLV